MFIDITEINTKKVVFAHGKRYTPSLALSLDGIIDVDIMEVRQLCISHNFVSIVK